MLEERHEIIEFSPNIPLKIFMHKLGFVARHWHKSLELLMVLEGTIEITLDGTTYMLNGEDIILINSNSIHEIHSESAVMIALQIDLARMNQFDNSLENLSFDCNSSTSSDSGKFNGIRFTIATMIRENAHNAKGAEYKNYALCYYLVSELLSNFQVPTTEAMKTQQKYMVRLTRIINYIQEHYAENFSLSDLAESEQLSVPYLSNFFDKHMGIKFSQYYTNVKLSHAVNDLLSSDDSIEAIAIKNGFTESHSFVRCFKKRYEMLPSTYRKDKKMQGLNAPTPENLNYLLIEPSSYLHKLTKYLGNIDESFYNTSREYTDEINRSSISVASPMKELKHTFKKFTTVGRAKELLNSNIQSMLRDLQEHIGYEYIKFHGILSDDMMVVSRTGGKLQFHYVLVDMALDFLMSIHLKPLIQLSFMPKELASDLNKTTFYSAFNTSPPKEFSEWELLIEDFTKHLIERYGIKEVLTWPFCVWNEPVTPKSMFGFGNDNLFFRFYEITYRTVKKVCPEIIFGSPSILYMENLGSDIWIRNFVAYTKKHNCIPEFMNMHYYSDIIPSVNNQNFYIAHAASSSFPKRTDDFSLWIGSIRKIISSLNLPDIPIYLTEWNFTLSHRNLINDTCFKSCYIMKNLLKNYDRLDSFGYWSLTDLLEENALPDTLFHGGLGIYTMNGLRKNVFYAFYFANMLGNELIMAEDGYFITRKEDCYQIITYNYIHYGNLFASGELFDITETSRYSAFDISRRLQVNLGLEQLENGRYEIIEYFVNREHGSCYDLWISMGGVPLNPQDTNLLRGLCVPGYHKEYRLVEKNTLSYTALLEPLEIRFAEIKPV
ncbi:GH39 family glycosyl hydrolase [Anaerocolumna xylanovorans]|uniref:Xylan 1,4-beta-xylosidase n=1 Tax=Anaerocolumna xylanovorans DSM 12503 TaxID=1121345 RepID=A0A1M7Y145_9FIRM|nr:helix-turn-helix domain-containing protein [Anaerocolumna xylanovorans]SHO45399.1 xylan 1,4-beta-xylosidase [Anaerocolumna xylanovorans DSM 12503]